MGYITAYFESLMEEYIIIAVVSFFYSMGAHANEADLCVREFSKSLKIRAYTWFVSLKPGSVHDDEHIFSLFKSKFFCVEAKLTLLELDWMRQIVGKDLEVYLKWFHENLLNC